MSNRVRQTEFYDKPPVDHYRQTFPLAHESTVKIVAKMLRELTHEKPPRGRPGRHLPQDQGICVNIEAKKQHFVYSQEHLFYISQKRISADDELKALERNQIFTSKGDLTRLAELHKRVMSKERVASAVNTLEDLISGLMGMGLQSVEWTEERYSKSWEATMIYDNFTITIEENK